VFYVSVCYQCIPLHYGTAFANFVSAGIEFRCRKAYLWTGCFKANRCGADGDAHRICPIPFNETPGRKLLHSWFPTGSDLQADQFHRATGFRSGAHIRYGHAIDGWRQHLGSPDPVTRPSSYRPRLFIRLQFHLFMVLWVSDLACPRRNRCICSSRTSDACSCWSPLTSTVRA
jgi:hypothetical protein